MRGLLLAIAALLILAAATNTIGLYFMVGKIEAGTIDPMRSVIMAIIYLILATLMLVLSTGFDKKDR